MERSMGFGNNPRSTEREKTPYDGYIGSNISISSGGVGATGNLEDCKPLGPGYDFIFKDSIYQKPDEEFVIHYGSNARVSSNGAPLAIHPQMGSLEERVEEMNANRLKKEKEDTT